MKEKICKLLTVLFVIVTFLSSCGEKPVTSYVRPSDMKTAGSLTVDENKDYILKWDDEAKCVLMIHKSTGRVWSTTPYDFYTSGETSMSLTSPIVIEYYDTTNGSVDMIRSYECVEENNISSEIKDSLLYVTYYFDNVKISVKVIYALREDSLELSLKTSDIKEGNDIKLIGIDIAPYLCSVGNTGSKFDWLFVPSGSGAIMYTDEEKIDAAREFSGNVYGRDLGQSKLDNPAEEEPIRIPAYGVKNGDYALCAIIENGEESCEIAASAGNPRNGYSNVYAKYNVHGYNNAEWSSINQSTITDTILLSPARSMSSELVIGYYPLFGEKADYNGMAECVRRYLTDKSYLMSSPQKQNAYHITLIGGAMVKKFTLGVPHKSFVAVTDFEESLQIIKELYEKTGSEPDVMLKGYGESGMNIEKISGGYGFAGALGNKKQQQELEKYCDMQRIPIYTDFDMMRFSKSGEGVHLITDSAMSANSMRASYYPIKHNVRVENTELDKIYFLKRSKLKSVSDKLLDFCDGKINGIALCSLGSIAYSDYRDESYYIKGGISAQVRELVSKFKKNGYKIAFSAANSYAAGLADSICDVPLQSGGYDALDETIPFYEMVYRGSIPLYSTPMNFSPDMEKQLLKAVEAGAAPSFMLGQNIESSLSDSSESIYYGILYQSNIAGIEKIVSKIKPYFEKIGNAGIKTHSILQEDVTKTVFENGTSVIVNHSEHEVTAEGKVIPALDFIVI